MNPWSYCPVGALGQHYQSWCPVSDSYSLLISFNKQDKILLATEPHSIHRFALLYFFVLASRTRDCIVGATVPTAEDRYVPGTWYHTETINEYLVLS